jgi:hypothetical protein
MAQGEGTEKSVQCSGVQRSGMKAVSERSERISNLKRIDPRTA